MRSFALSEIPGYSEALMAAQIESVQTQEDDWLGATDSVCGVTIRKATLRDYVLVLRFAPSILHRLMPESSELILLLWILSPEREGYDYGTNWRRQFPTLRQLARRRHVAKVKAALKIEELEKAAVQYAQESNESMIVPEDHPYSQAVEKLYQYFDKVFAMRPASMKGGSPNGMHFLVGWFNALQKNFHLTTEEVWAMPLPILFARLRDLQQSESRGRVPNFNERADALNKRITDALRSGQTTVEDLLAGKFKLN